MADEVNAISAEVRAASDAFEVVITAGGVGPTRDDVTMAGVAEALGKPLLRYAKPFFLLATIVCCGICVKLQEWDGLRVTTVCAHASISWVKLPLMSVAIPFAAALACACQSVLCSTCTFVTLMHLQELCSLLRYMSALIDCCCRECGTHHFGGKLHSIACPCSLALELLSLCTQRPDTWQVQGYFQHHICVLHYSCCTWMRRDSGLVSRLRTYFGSNITAAHLKMAEAPQGNAHCPAVSLSIIVCRYLMLCYGYANFVLLSAVVNSAAISALLLM